MALGLPFIEKKLSPSLTAVTLLDARSLCLAGLSDAATLYQTFGASAVTLSAGLLWADV